jgi:hypothetical protein
MEEPKRTYELKVPFEFGGREIRSLEFRAPRGKDMRSIPIGGLKQIGDLLDLASVLCAEPAPVLDRLAMEDVGPVLGIVALFIEAGLGTPTTV